MNLTTPVSFMRLRLLRMTILMLGERSRLLATTGNSFDLVLNLGGPVGTIDPLPWIDAVVMQSTLGPAEASFSAVAVVLRLRARCSLAERRGPEAL